MVFGKSLVMSASCSV